MMLPDQVSNFWDIIKYAIEQSVPPIEGDSPDKMNNVLAELLSFKKQCWASYIVEGDKRIFEGIVITQVIDDTTAGTRSLLIYCLYGYREVAKESWIKGAKALAKYAKSKGCNRMLAYTDVPSLIEIAVGLGGEARYTLVSLNTDKIVQIINDL